MVGKTPSGMPRSIYSGSHPSTQMTTVGRRGVRYRRPFSSIASDIAAPPQPGCWQLSRQIFLGARITRAPRKAGAMRPRRHRSAFARLILRGRFGSGVVGTGRGPLLLSLKLLVLSGLFGAVALGTLIAVIRFAHQQTPGDLM